METPDIFVVEDFRLENNQKRYTLYVRCNERETVCLPWTEHTSVERFTAELDKLSSMIKEKIRV